LALLPDVLRKFAGSGSKLVWARVVSTGFRLGELSSSERGVAARLNMPRRTPTEQRANAHKMRGLKMPDAWELAAGSRELGVWSIGFFAGILEVERSFS
jgi:hypothetical protein